MAADEVAVRRDTRRRGRVRSSRRALTRAVVFALSIAAALVFWELDLAHRAHLGAGPPGDERRPSRSSGRSMQTSHFWCAFADTVRGWALGLLLSRPCSPSRSGSSLGSSDFAGERVPRADRVPAPDPVGRADPGPLPDARHDAQERGLPRDVRRVLAAPDPDDLRRPRRRPASRSTPRARSASAGSSASTGSRCRAPSPYIVDRPAHLVDGLADPRVHGRALHGHPGPRPGGQLRVVVRARRRALRARARHRASSASRSTSS